MRERVIKQGGKLAFERIAAMKSQEALRALQAKRFWIANRKYSLIFENPPFSKTSIARNRIHNERFARIRPYLKDGKQQRLWGVQGFEKLLAAEPKKQGNWLRSEDLKGLLQLHFEFLETGDLLAFKTPGQKARIQYSLFMTPKDQDHCRRAPRWLCFD